ncbi:MAG TPA: hypothetical protein VHV54_06410 [Candidatus Binatia bacterium]|nr:hypothetical protein [Candidatus Binatia bacterium]
MPGFWTARLNPPCCSPEDWPFNLWFRAEENALSLYAEVSSTQSTAPAYEIIKRISKRFDGELGKGQYQSEFIGSARVK